MVAITLRVMSACVKCILAYRDALKTLVPQFVKMHPRAVDFSDTPANIVRR
jgi:hypothetical protein